MFEVWKLRRFDKEARKVLSADEFRQLETICDRLFQNPWIGDPLGPWWFREAKLGVKRVYYIVGKRVLLLRASNKNNQDSILDALRDNLDSYKKIADANGRE